MSQRFQFSLARSLISVALLFVASIPHRKALSVLPSVAAWPVAISERCFYAAALWEAAFSVCLALAVGVMAKRTVSFLIGAVIAVLPVLLILRSVYYYYFGWKP
jgi:hypothetical protein